MSKAVYFVVLHSVPASIELRTMHSCCTQLYRRVFMNDVLEGVNDYFHSG